MSHPHEELLQDFRHALARLVPLAPKAVVDEANQIAADLEADKSSTPEQIRQALIYIGKKEFPYRKAYQELCAGDEEARLQTLVLGSLDDTILEKMEPVTKYGVHILDYVKSSQFESQLSDEDRSAVDREILAAHGVLNKQCDERATKRKNTFDDLVTQWTTAEVRIQMLIDTFKGIADRDEQYRDDILARVNQFEEGWSMIEADPTEEDVQKEIEYWTGVINEGAEDGVEE